MSKAELSKACSHKETKFVDVNIGDVVYKQTHCEGCKMVLRSEQRIVKEGVK